MFKGKKWLIGVCSMLLAFGIAACSGSDDDSSSSTPPASVPDSSQSSSETPLDPTVTLSSETLDMDLFAKSTLTASLTDLTGEVVWSTSDASVATVENGVVRAVGVGTATITATVGEYSDSCAVTIVRGEKKPTFDAFGAVNVIVGQTYDLEATLSLDEEDFELATVTYASTGEFLTVTPEGKITGVKEGTQTITATATYGEETLATAEISVSVIEVGTIETGIDMNALALMATNYTGESKTEHSLENFVTYVNGVAVEKEISYTVQDNTVVKVEDGKIVALATGETVVTAEFTSDTNKKYSVDITVSVGKELVAQDVEFSAKGNSETTQNTGIAEIDFAGKTMDINVSDITGVKCNGQSITFTTNGTVLTLTDAPSGENVYVFETAKVDVQVEGFIYQRTISSKEELVAFGANYNGNYGYTILTADIDMGGDVFALQTGAWLRCTFDGQGHTISNVRTTTGFLGDFNERGVLKNLQLVNIVLDSPEEDTKSQIGLLARCPCGTIENVFVMGYVMNAKENQSLIAGNDYDSTVYKNIIIIASTDKPMGSVSGSGINYMQAKGATGYGVHYITPHSIQVKPAGSEKLDAVAYASLQEFAEKADLSTFEEPWDSENMLMSDISDNVPQFEVSFKGEIAVGNTITVDTTLFDAVVTIKEETSNAVVSGRNIELKANGIYTVVVSSAAYTGVSKEVELLCLTNEALTTTETYVETSGGNTKMDLSKLSKTIAEVTSMTVNGKAVTPTVNENEVTFTNAQTGMIEVSIYSESEAKIYTFTLNVADFIINDAEEFKTFANAMGNYKYVVLANDITMSASVGLERKGVAFTGTFDGQNYTVRNANFKLGIFVNNGFAPGGVFKNVKFDNLILGGYGLFGAYLSGGLIENFHATVNFTPNYNYSDKWSAYLCEEPTGRGDATFTIKNSTFVFNGSDKTKKLKLYTDENYYPTILENVNILVSGLVAKPGEEDFNGKVQTNEAKTAGWVNVTIKDSRDGDAIAPTVSNEKWTLDLTTLGLTGKTISVVKDQVGNSVEFTQSGDVLTFMYEKQVALILTLIASDDTTATAFVCLPYYAMAETADETTYGVEYVKVTDGALSIDLSKVGVEIKDLNRVLVNNEKATYTVDGTMVNVTGYAGAVGESKIHLRAGEAWYVFDVIIADYLISDQASLKAWGSKTNRENLKYAVLTQDITCDGSDLTMYDGKPANVLNGLGHKVVGAHYALGFYANAQPKAGSAMKNITFEGMILDTPYYSLFGTYISGCVFENVNVSATYTKFPNYGLIFGEMNGRNGSIVLRNCNFSFTVPEADTDKVARLYNDSNGYYGAIMENVTIMSNGKIADAGELSEGHSAPGVTLGAQSTWTNVKITDKDSAKPITTSEKYLVLTDGKATLDLTKLSETVAVSNVMIGTANVEYSVADNKLTFATSAGLINVMLEDATANKTYTLQVKVADVVMTNFAELKAFWENNTVFTNSKYAVIANDITCEDTVIQAIWNEKNVGVIDGLGNTVTNMTMTRGIFMNVANVTLRDITFENFTSMNNVVKSGTNLFTTGLIAYYATNLDVINVNMTTTLSADNWKNCKNLLGSCDAGGGYGYSFVGCSFDIGCREDMKATAMSVTGEMWYYMGSFTNTTITYAGTLDLAKDFAQAGAKITYSNATFTDMNGTQTK